LVVCLSDLRGVRMMFVSMASFFSPCFVLGEIEHGKTCVISSHPIISFVSLR